MARVCKDTYKEVRVFHRPNGGIDRVYIPDLTPEERERRMRMIKEAAAALIISYRKLQAERAKKAEEAKTAEQKEDVS